MRFDGLDGARGQRRCSGLSRIFYKGEVACLKCKNAEFAERRRVTIEFIKMEEGIGVESTDNWNADHAD